MKPLHHTARSLSILVVFALFAALAPVTPIHSQASSGQPELLKDINPGSEYSMPKDFIHLNGKDFFTAFDAEHWLELWVTDGTPDGTHLFLDINPGPFHGVQPIHPKDYTEQAIANGVFYFNADDGQSGFELWRTDGTLAGTWQVKDIRPGAPGSNSGAFTNVNGVIYFVVDDGYNNSQLWKTDGTADGTVLVRDFDYEDSPGTIGVDTQTAVMAPLGNLLIFGVNYGSYYKLWRSDGTDTGKTAFFTGDYGSDPVVGNWNWPRFMLSHGGLVYFDMSVLQDLSTGDKLWVSDGTYGGTKIIGTKTGTTYKYYAPRDLTWIGDTLYFSAEDRADSQTLVNKYSIWKLSPGTLEAEEVVGPLDSTPTQLTRLDTNRMVFWRYNAATQKSSLWITNGTAAGTSALCPDCFGLVDYSSTPFFGKIYFSADPNIPADPYDYSGLKIWATDGTASGTQIFSSLRPHWPYYVSSNHLYFSVIDATTGEEPWVYEVVLNNHLYLPGVRR
jgi:ELWxxDGT repeat protein